MPPAELEDDFKAKLDAGLCWKILRRTFHLKRYLVQKSTSEDTLRVQTVRDVIARLEARGAP